MLQNLPVCGNCHSFADNGSVLGLDVDYGNDKGGYGIMPVSTHMVMNDEKIITWADYKRDDGELTFGLLSRVSPTGRYVISTVKDRSVFVAIPDLMISQLFFPIKGILVVYDRETKTFAALPGADDPQYVQTNAVWSPDGQEIVVRPHRRPTTPSASTSRTARCSTRRTSPSSPSRSKPFRYDLYRIPFNDGKGGTPMPLEGASNNGMSNYFPKYSPDGKWIVFTKSKSYMLLQPDSELYIVPDRGRRRAAPALQHRAHELLAQLVVEQPLAGLLLEGERAVHAALPHPHRRRRQRQPAGPARALHLAGPRGEHPRVRQPARRRHRRHPRAVPRRLLVPARRASPTSTPATTRVRNAPSGAASRSRPDDVELRNALGWTLFQDGRTAEAVTEYKRALAADPKHAKAHNNLALALVELGQLDEAADPLPGVARDRAQGGDLQRPRLHPGAAGPARRTRSRTTGRRSRSIRTARRRTSTWPSPSVQAGDLGEAESHYRQALPGRPTAETHNGLGYVLARQGRTDEAHRGVPQGDRRRPEVHARVQQPRGGAGAAGQARGGGGLLPALARGAAERRPSTTRSAASCASSARATRRQMQFSKAKALQFAR